MHTITALDLKAILQRIQERGAVDSAHRVLQLCGQDFRYAMAGHQAERNPAADLKGWLPSPARRIASSGMERIRLGGC